MMIQDIVNELKNNNITQRQFIIKVKGNIDLIKEVQELTQFLNEYNVDILERLYYIINDIHDIVKCKYCNNKAIFSGRINEGYKDICNNKECRKKQLKELHIGSNKISSNRDNTFINWQNNVITINDNIIKDNIKYDKYVNLITNENITTYLNNRFKDSDSLLETVQRIRFNIEEKPKCPTCNKPVKWIGKQSKLYTTYCCNECSAKSQNTIDKKKATQLRNWGTENCYDSKKYKAQYKEKYGVDSLFKRDDIKEKRRQTLLKKYGVEHPNQNKEIMDKVWQTCKEHMSFTKSTEEDNIYNWLLELGYKVERQYKSDEYPFNCDFYLIDYNVYIEYQGSQFHNDRAFLNTTEDKNDIKKLQDITKKKVSEGKHPQSAAIIDTWSIRDVYKRNFALEHNINLLEIYYCKSIYDLKQQLDLYLNCLYNKQIYTINKDYLNNEFEYYKNLFVNNIDNISSVFTKNNIVKHFCGNLFYKNEIYIYAHDPVNRRKLIQNRCKYLNKKENELTVNDIFLGFKISGIYYGYSHFNPKWTNWFINKFNIKTVYDPCGGWGHHMLGMLSCKKIIYNDLSTSTYNGVLDIKHYFNIDNLECHNEDGSKYIPENVDAFFMCPPYYNIESYECDNFKSLDEYKNFLNDIFNIWYNNSASIFGLILREDFEELITYDYSERYELKISTSHLVKDKKNKEYFYIYKK